PKWTGRMYNERLGKIHFWLTLIFFNMIFFVQHFLGLAGMPRRIPDYPLMFETWNQISTIGAYGFGVSLILFVYIVITCIRSGERPSSCRGGVRTPWNGRTSPRQRPPTASRPRPSSRRSWTSRGQIA